MIDFERASLVVGVGDSFYSKNHFRSPKEELTPAELLEAADDAQSRGESPTGFLMTYHWRWGQALARWLFQQLRRQLLPYPTP